MFAVTNVDDVLVLALFFAQADGRPGAEIRVVAGQYLGFAGILAASVLGALGTQLLPETLVAYLGLLPLALGLRAGWRTWRDRRVRETGEKDEKHGESGPGVFGVAVVTFANGGDNIGVYVPVFATSGAGGVITYCTVFLVLVAAWCALGRFFATRPVVAPALARCGHLLLPVVLIGIGLVILVDGGAFGL
jgi:cadmium resistance protein CadD (predicted permease)